MDGTITNTNPEPTTGRANNNTNDKIDADMSGASGAAIKDMNARPTTSGSNNDTNNKVDASTLDILGMTIKDTDTKLTTGGTNNNTDAKIDAGVFMGEAISKIDAEFIIGGLRRVNTIVEKKIYKYNLF